MAALGELVVSLSANTAKFTEGLNKAEYSAQKSFQKMSDNAKKYGAILGGIAVAGVTAFAYSVKQAIDAADDMSKASQKIGVTTEALSALKYAADLSGVSFEQLQNGLTKLSINIDEASSGTLRQVETFDRLGISIRNLDGSLKPADKALLEIADRFQKMPDGIEKSALAAQLFGLKMGSSFIPLLNGGSEALQKATYEAEKLGLILSGETGRAAEEFNDNMSRLKKSMDGFALVSAARLTPALVEITNAMAEATKESGLLYGVWIGMGGVMANILGLDYATQQMDDARKGLVSINRELAGIQGKLGGGKKSLTGGGLVPYTDEEINAMILRLKELGIEKARLDGIMNPTSQSPVRKINQPLIVMPTSEELAAQKAAAREITAAKKKSIDEQTKDLQDQINFEQEIIEFRNQEELDMLADREEEKRLIISETVSKQKEFNAEVERVKNSVDPLREYTVAIKQLGEMFDMGRLTAEEFATASANAQKEMLGFADKGKTGFDELKNAIDGFARDGASAMTDFIFGTKGSFSDMVNSMLKDLARLALQKSLFEPLVSGASDAFSSSSGGIAGLLGGMFGGGRAQGGDVQGGKSYLVGEYGPEVVTMGGNGTVTPSSNGSVTVSVNVDASGGSFESNTSFGKQLGNAIKTTVQSEMLRQKRQGGLLT